MDPELIGHLQVVTPEEILEVVRVGSLQLL